MLEHDPGGLAQVVHPLEQRPPAPGVLPHLHPLLAGEGPVLEQDPVGDGDLPDVVEQRAALDDPEIGLGDAHLEGQPPRVPRHPLGVGSRARVPRVEGAHEALQEGLGALPDNLLQVQVLAPELLRKLLVPAPERRRVGRLGHRRDQFHLAGWLLDDAVHLARVDGLHDDVGVRMAGAEDAGRPGAAGDRHLEEGDAVHLGHDEVGDDDVGPLELDRGEGREGARVAGGGEPGPLQHLGQQFQDQRVVVDDEDARHRWNASWELGSNPGHGRAPATHPEHGRAHRRPVYKTRGREDRDISREHGLQHARGAGDGREENFDAGRRLRRGLRGHGPVPDPHHGGPLRPHRLPGQEAGRNREDGRPRLRRRPDLRRADRAPVRHQRLASRRRAPPTSTRWSSPAVAHPSTSA